MVGTGRFELPNTLFLMNESPRMLPFARVGFAVREELGCSRSAPRVIAEN